MDDLCVGDVVELWLFECQSGESVINWVLVFKPFCRNCAKMRLIACMQ